MTKYLTWLLFLLLFLLLAATDFNIRPANTYDYSLAVYSGNDNIIDTLKTCSTKSNVDIFYRDMINNTYKYYTTNNTESSLYKLYTQADQTQSYSNNLHSLDTVISNQLFSTKYTIEIHPFTQIHNSNGTLNYQIIDPDAHVKQFDSCLANNDLEYEVNANNFPVNEINYYLFYQSNVGLIFLLITSIPLIIIHIFKMEQKRKEILYKKVAGYKYRSLLFELNNQELLTIVGALFTAYFILYLSNLFKGFISGFHFFIGYTLLPLSLICLFILIIFNFYNFFIINQSSSQFLKNNSKKIKFPRYILLGLIVVCNFLIIASVSYGLIPKLKLLADNYSIAHSFTFLDSLYSLQATNNKATKSIKAANTLANNFYSNAVDQYKLYVYQFDCDNYGEDVIFINDNVLASLGLPISESSEAYYFDPEQLSVLENPNFANHTFKHKQYQFDIKLPTFSDSSQISTENPIIISVDESFDNVGTYNLYAKSQKLNEQISLDGVNGLFNETISLNQLITDQKTELFKQLLYLSINISFILIALFILLFSYYQVYFTSYNKNIIVKKVAGYHSYQIYQDLFIERIIIYALTVVPYYFLDFNIYPLILIIVCDFLVFIHRKKSNRQLQKQLLREKI